MIYGAVNAWDEAVIPATILDFAGKPHLFDAVVDTGFNGALILPSATIASLGLPWRFQAETTLADGSVVECDIYHGTVLWDGILMSAAVESSEIEPIVGLALLHGHLLCIEVIDGGKVTIQALP